MIKVSLEKFVDYGRNHIQGNERSEAQSFLNAFFRAFGYEDAIQAGARFEKKIKKGSKAGKTGYADLVWEKRLLVEMKSRGLSLEEDRHQRQVERYWLRLGKEKPKYSILCNFDEFRIFDFDNQPDEPLDVIPLERLPNSASAFKFMLPGTQRPVFSNNQVEITEQTAAKMGQLLDSLVKRGRAKNFREFSEHQAQRLVLQCVLAMFAEDREMLPDAIFVACVDECLEGGSSYDLLGGLFQAMDERGIRHAGRYKGVEYFNGGLFSEIHPIDLNEAELLLLKECAKEDWSKVRPSIFGSIFEAALNTDKQKRRAHGVHFTSESDIRKIVLPTISDYWEERIDSTNSLRKLQQLHKELCTYRVLDPACGSGNFLYVAYQELKRVERVLIRKMIEKDESKPYMSLVTPQQLYGIDINPFAVELAKTTLMIGRKVAIDTLGLPERSLPLDTLDNNIFCEDALFCDWPRAEAVIGNPPFLGGSRIRTEWGDEYAEKLFRRFSTIRAQVDYSSYWFRLTHDHISESARAGLVATNSMRQGKSKSVSLDYITENHGFIHEAISTQPWSGDAVVHVCLVNWSKKKPDRCFLDNQSVPDVDYRNSGHEESDYSGKAGHYEN